MRESLSLFDLATFGAALGGGLALGLILRFAFGRLAERATRTRWTGDEVAYRFLRSLSVGLCLIAGLAVGAHVLPLTPGTLRVTDRGLLALSIVIVTLALARMAGELVRAAAGRRIGSSMTIFGNVTRVLVVVAGILVLLQTLGVPIAPLLTALGVGGLAVALALQDTLSNLFAGIYILATRKVKPGDYIRLDSGEEGYVVDINWRNTSVRQLPNNMILVPNARLAQSIVTNFHQPEREMSVRVEVGVAYESDLEAVERVTVEVASEVLKEVPGAIPDFRPFVRYHTFGNSSIDFSVVLRAREYTDQYLVQHEFVKRLHRRYAQEGIVIPFPMRTVELKGPLDPAPDGAAGRA